MRQKLNKIKNHHRCIYIQKFHPFDQDYMEDYQKIWSVSLAKEGRLSFNSVPTFTKNELISFAASIPVINESFSLEKTPSRTFDLTFGSSEETVLQDLEGF